MTELLRPRAIAIVTGMLGSGKTTLIARLLSNPAMVNTLVLVNEFGEIGLDHHLLKAVTDTVMLLPNGCLCCTVKDDVLQTLREVRRTWLSGDLPDVERILIETTGLAEPATLVAAIASDPLIDGILELSAVSTVIDAENGLWQIENRTTCRNQIRVADRLLLSKIDLVDATKVVALTSQLAALNPLATVEDSRNVEPDRLFRRDFGAPSRSNFACDEPSEHIEQISTIMLRPSRKLLWRPFQIWLGGILDAYGDHLLRLKGQLTFADQLTKAVVIQAVHHHFYPVIELAGETSDDFLVLIFERAISSELTRAIEVSQFSIVREPPVSSMVRSTDATR